MAEDFYARSFIPSWAKSASVDNRLVNARADTGFALKVGVDAKVPRLMQKSA